MLTVFEWVFLALLCFAFIVIVLSDTQGRTKAEPRARVGRPQTS